MFIVGKTFFSKILSKFNTKTVAPLCIIQIPKKCQPQGRQAHNIAYFLHGMSQEAGQKLSTNMKKFVCIDFQMAAKSLPWQVECSSNWQILKVKKVCGMLVRRNLKEFNDFIYLGANRVRKLMVILINSIYIKDSLYR